MPTSRFELKWNTVCGCVCVCVDVMGFVDSVHHLGGRGVVLLFFPEVDGRRTAECLGMTRAVWHRNQ